MNAPSHPRDMPGPRNEAAAIRAELDNAKADDIASRVHIVGKDDRLNLADMKGGSLHTLRKSELEQILGRTIVLDSQNRPLLSDKDKNLIGIALEIQELLASNPRLDKDAKIRVMEAMRRLSGKNTREGFLAQARQTIIGEETVSDLIPWANGPLHLQRVESSAFHKMREAWAAGECCVPMMTDSIRVWDAGMRKAFDDVDTQIFVIQHDWAAAFKGATDFAEGESKLPFQACGFEYRISGRRVIAHLVDAEDGRGISCLLIFQASSGVWALPWYWTYDNGKMTPTARSPEAQQRLEGDFLRGAQRVADLIGQNIRAVSISLEAEAAATEIVRAPHRLNRAREKAGKLPIYDYHVVSLARRSRPAALPRDPNAEPGTRKRLHFRRGHWRHFEKHKTWINWMLVGNPDLGFIDKEYRL